MGTAPRTWELGLAGGICTLLGVGLARFGYTPLIPVLVDARWFSLAQANYLGAINLLGYLIGAIAAHHLALRFGFRRLLGISLLLTVASFYACAWNGGVTWYGLWRFGSGVTGAVLIIVGAAQALMHVPRAARPLTAALVFSGLGFGIAASGTLVPWLLRFGIPALWLAMAVLGTLLSLWSWQHVWRRLAPAPIASTPAAAGRLPRLAAGVIGAVFAAYALDAAGFVPHTLFWVDYIAHELGRGVHAGAGYWTLLGLGAAAGSFLGGALARRTGFLPALGIMLTIKATAVALPIFCVQPAALALSSVLVGMAIPGVVTLASGAIMELAPAARQQQLWGRATLAFALLQAGSAYGLAWLHTLFGSYHPLFILAACCMVSAALIASGGAAAAHHAHRP